MATGVTFLEEDLLAPPAPFLRGAEIYVCSSLRGDRGVCGAVLAYRLRDYHYFSFGAVDEVWIPRLKERHLPGYAAQDNDSDSDYDPD